MKSRMSRVRTLGSLGTEVWIAVAAMLVTAPPCAGRDPKLTAATQIWRVVDAASGHTYYAQSIEAGWFAMGGGLFSANGTGTVTYMPTQTPEPSRLGSEDSWRVGETVPGATAAWKGKQSGIAMITSGGVQNPSPPSGKGYISVKFRDLQTKKPISISKFAAEKVRAGDVEGLLSKKR